MKKLLLQFIALLLFNFTTLAQENWSWLNPLPQGNDLNDVYVMNENNIIAVGDRGTLLRSVNGGADWEITYRLSNIEQDIVDIQFISDQKGYLLANDPSSKILLTDDEGINWKVIAEFDTVYINDFFFISENIGWVIGVSGEYGTILKTTDGGIEWYTQLIQNISSLGGFSTIQFIDSLNGWAGGKGCSFFVPNGELLKTTDGGSTWSGDSDSMYTVKYIQFLSSEIGWMRELVGCYGPCVWQILKTTNGGISWENPQVPVWFYFVNTNVGWSVGDGEVYKTTDGGSSWITVSANTPVNPAIHFNNENNGCIVGDNGGIITTQNGGQSWVERSEIILDYQLLSVNFYDENIGWITGYILTFHPEGSIYTGIIYKTTDGGNSWAEKLCVPGGIGSDEAQTIYNVQSVSDQTVYAVGPSIFKTTDGGANWGFVNRPRPGYLPFKSLFFVNENIGFVGGGYTYPNSGFGLYKTTNGGMEWDTVFSGSVESIFFTNSSTGWFVAGSSIYKSADQGNTWEEIWVSSAWLNSICFADEDLGLAAGNDGIIIRTTDGGSNWNEIFNLEDYEFKSVCFADSNSAIVVGRETGGIWLTENTDGIIVSIDKVGGLYSINYDIWTPGLNDVFSYANNVWAVGDGGTIIKSGAVTFVEEEINEIPTNYSLSNNFPNPFNPSTKIRYSVPKLSNVQIKIYDVLGNEIETLVNQEKPVGTYEITWHAENLPSGVYFYQLKAEDFVETKKMLLIR